MSVLVQILIVALCVAALAWLVPNRVTPLLRRHRARMHMIQRSRLDDEARPTMWDGTVNGGIGVITYPRGSVQAHYDKGEYNLEWYGRSDHPVRHEQLVTRNERDFLERLRQWSSRGHVHRRDFDRAGPMMII